MAGERQGDRRGGSNSKRKRAACRDDQPRQGRRAKRHEFFKPPGVQRLDRQRQKRFASAGNEDRSSGMKFTDAAINADLPFRPE